MCHRHDGRAAAVACQRCEQPICADCMNQASVGFHCPACTTGSAQKVIRAADLSAASRPPVTVALIALNVAIFVAQRMGIVSFTNDGLLLGRFVSDGEWWRVVTSAFLHGDLMHVGFNVFTLWIFGEPLERALGPVRFAVIYAAGLLGGSTAILLFAYNQPTLGASGAVLGLAGALTAVMWARGISMRQTSLSGILLFNLALPLFVPRISFWGHFGGVVGGFAAGWLLSFLPERYKMSAWIAMAAAVGLCGLLVVLTLIGPGLLGNA